MESNNKYNKVYDTLVQNDKDFVGMLAYAFYKRQKQEYIKDLKLNNKKSPSDSDLESFIKIANSKNQIDTYRNMATELTGRITNEILISKQKEIKEFANRHFYENKSIWHYTKQSIIPSIINNIIWLIFMGLIAFLFWASKQNLKNILISFLQNS